ncbi:hypothetical protein BUE80_DR005317 [Diplocarpon rosae]|nr:hypothetical protein BUE80_DR005317 [Diplocarpon rosae]
MVMTTALQMPTLGAHRLPQFPRPYSSSTSPTRLTRLHARLPRFLHRYTSALLSAPGTHITAFLILHEVTAILPLVGLAGAFHYSNWLPEAWVQGRWVTEGTERFGRYFGRKGWFGFGTAGGEGLVGGEGEGGGKGGKEGLEQQVEMTWHAGSQGTRILVEVATAYALTKVLLPVRVLVSVWGTPWFARVFVGRLGGLIRRGKNMGMATGRKTRSSAAAGTGASGGGVGPGGG